MGLSSLWQDDGLQSAFFLIYQSFKKSLIPLVCNFFLKLSTFFCQTFFPFNSHFKWKRPISENKEPILLKTVTKSCPKPTVTTVKINSKSGDTKYVTFLERIDCKWLFFLFGDFVNIRDFLSFLHNNYWRLKKNYFIFWVNNHPKIKKAT